MTFEMISLSRYTHTRCTIIHLNIGLKNYRIVFSGGYLVITRLISRRSEANCRFGCTIIRERCGFLEPRGLRRHKKRRLAYVVHWVAERWFMFLWPQYHYNMMDEIKVLQKNSKKKCNNVIKRIHEIVYSWQLSQLASHYLKTSGEIYTQNITADEKANTTLYLLYSRA